MDGWIKLHRKLMRSSMYRQLNSKQRDVMLTVLLLANHESNTWEFRGEVYSVQPGQFITSLESLKEYCASDVSTQNIRTALLKLEKHGFLTNESTKKNRLITVVNWGLYQCCDGDSNKETNRQLTNNQQTANKQLTTNKNEKNVKNDKNVKKKDINTFSAYTSNTELISALESFVEFRKKIKKPMTDRAIELLLNNLDKLASDDSEKIAVLEQSILNGWQTVYPLKNRGGEKNAADRESVADPYASIDFGF